MPPRRDPLTVEQLSARAGVSPRTWRTHRERGAPVPHGKTPREVERWLLAYHAWRLDNLAQQKHGNDDQDPEANEADAEAWSVERKKWLALLAKTEWHLRTGRLVPREEVVEFAVKAGLTVRNRLNSAVPKLAPLVYAAQSQEQVEEILQLEVDEILSTFARSLEPLDQEVAADDDKPAD
jgi:phage terminase Nu1 subunit (DNA packaging protein)